MATKPRSRKRKAADTPTTEMEPVRINPNEEKNLSPFESTLSVYAGAVLLIAALFPRTFKQLLLLAFSAGLIYRGQRGHCDLYKALDIDTNKGGLLKQLGEKLLS